MPVALMADRIDISDLGSVPLFTAKTRGKRNMLAKTIVYGFFKERNDFFKNICGLKPSPISELQKLQTTI